MELHEIFLAILDKPDVPKFYRELRNHYQSINKLQEASAISYLLKKKFEKKDESIDNPDASQK
jgi:hypothetical protein